MFNFIDYYTEFYKERESPDEFWYWSAISVLAGVMRDNVYLKVLDERIYPNLYTILIADSGIYRKAAPCRAAARLVREVGNTRLLEGRNSIQSAVKELGEVYINLRGDSVKGASALLYNEELASMLVKDDQAISLLITLYDYHEEWSDNLISRGRVELNDVCLSMLSASNSKLFDSVYSPEAIEGGLLGRTLIIKPNSKRPRRSLFNFSQETLPKEPLVEHLKRIATMRGPIHYSPEAESYYNDWYNTIPEHVFEDRIGFGSRLGTHVFKVSLALAASREDFELVIEEKDVCASITACLSLRKNYQEVTMGSGISSRSKQTAIILQLFLKQPSYQLHRATLIQKTLGDIEGEVLDNILTYLEQAEMIRSFEIQRGTPGYKLTQKAIDMILGED